MYSCDLMASWGVSITDVFFLVLCFCILACVLGRFFKFTILWVSHFFFAPWHVIFPTSLIDGLIDGWMNGWMEEWMDGWVDGFAFCWNFSFFHWKYQLGWHLHFPCRQQPISSLVHSVETDVCLLVAMMNIFHSIYVDGLRQISAQISRGCWGPQKNSLSTFSCRQKPPQQTF